ncbi:hypothetical protein Clacol_009524 [Clathrus columnatus]|uniref:Uncharacterized protein n=1 Tax=Clathrus columnatus TaxID=1419009 RepID=A0AAV5AQD0_9AGAM|nr:hypothetical protein Clacol_009524 [Clathrus columnatus]
MFCAPNFCLNDVIDAPWDYINTQLASQTTKGFSDDWAKHSVSICIPSGIKKTKKQMKRPEKEDISIENQFFTVDGVLVRPLVSVIKDTFAHSSAIKSFHFELFKQYWESPDSPRSGICVYDEIYTSDAFHKAHEDLQNSPKELGCDLPRAVIALMFWSDSTSLAQFGNASLWPIYLYWGNQSKYKCCHPSADACQHIAHLPKVNTNL